MSGQVLPSPPAALKLFILGSARSGTSITYFAAREVLGLFGRGEGHVIPIFLRLNHQFYLYAREFAEQKGTMAKDLLPRPFKVHLQDFLRRFYKNTYNRDSFVDKTPGAESIQAAGFILETFPEAKIIVMRRTGIEVVQSYRQKFNAEFVNACRSWVDCMGAIQATRKNCPGVLEIDQFDLTNAPAETGRRIAEYVGASDRAEALAKFFTERRVEQSSEHDWRERLTMEKAGWSEAERVQFTEICGPTMKAFGYPM